VTGPTSPRIIMLTTFDLDQQVYDALRAGANGLLEVTAERSSAVMPPIRAGSPSMVMV